MLIFRKRCAKYTMKSAMSKVSLQALKHLRVTFGKKSETRPT